MKLIALNRTWAVYQDDGAAEGGFDAPSALDALLSIRSYKDLLSFLIRYSCRKSFAFPSDTPYRGWDKKMKLWSEQDLVHGLTGSLASALGKYLEIDYLDAVTAADLNQTETFDIHIAELMEFRETIKKFLTVAAIATGSQSPSGLFKESDTGSIFSEDWWRDFVGTSMSESKTFLFDLHDAGVKRHGIFDPWFFEESLFYKDIKFGRYPDGVNFSGFILSVPEYDPENSNDLTDYVSVTCTKSDQASVDTAQKACAGYVIATILNHVDSIFVECSSLSLPPLEEDALTKYSFNLESGFVENKVREPDFWFDLLLDEAVKAIIDKRVKLCPQCGAPVVVKDYRGRFEKEFCSNRCKTAASKNRRERAIRLAASGVPVEVAIMEIGERHSESIKNWYEEVEKTNLAC